MKIHFGFEDLPYNKSSSYKAVGRSRPRRLKSTANITTGEVAKILEERYGIIEFFFEQNAELILRRITRGYVKMLTRPERGRGSQTDFLKQATDGLEERFREMLDRKKLDGHIEGVPTMASVIGQRWGRGNRPGRPSFVDTGLYRNSFRVRVEED